MKRRDGLVTVVEQSTQELYDMLKATLSGVIVNPRVVRSMAVELSERPDADAKLKHDLYMTEAVYKSGNMSDREYLRSLRRGFGVEARASTIAKKTKKKLTMEDLEKDFPVVCTISAGAYRDNKELIKKMFADRGFFEKTIFIKQSDNILKRFSKQGETVMLTWKRELGQLKSAVLTWRGKEKTESLQAMMDFCVSVNGELDKTELGKRQSQQRLF